MSRLARCHPIAWRGSLPSCLLWAGIHGGARPGTVPQTIDSRCRCGPSPPGVGASAQPAAVSEAPASAALGLELEPTLGIETHVQLSTRTKAFCSCSNEYGGEINSRVCPVCMGQPGALPVLNEEVVRSAVKSGLALKCTIHGLSKFDRKQYFYPDLPKGYQISQFDEPVCTEGKVEITLGEGTKSIRIERLHMEEDAGKTIYAGTSASDRLAGSDSSLVDYNRAGVPLLEIVSGPDMRSGEEAAAYAAEIRRIMLYLGVSDGNMAEGSMRCDVNVSVAPKGSDKLGTRVEIKNMNSFSGMQKAIDFEVQRQSVLIQEGREGEILKETRLWDEAKQETYGMRRKEGLADYRYFPEPDLPPLVVDQDYINTIKSGMPELPQQRRERYLGLGLPRKDVLVLTDEADIGNFFDQVLDLGAPAKAVTNWLLGDIMAYCKSEKLPFSELKMTAAALSEMVMLIESGTISGKIGKKILPELLSGKGNSGVQAYVEKKGLVQISDPAQIEAIVDKVMEANPEQVEKFRGGKNKLMGFFVGEVMKESRGRANPGVVNKMLQKKLNA
eukprot:evm.model.scf_3150.2 EVM.evm.TU.scf_3150.2   scf_3150:5450-9315(-)